MGTGTWKTQPAGSVVSAALHRLPRARRQQPAFAPRAGARSSSWTVRFAPVAAFPLMWRCWRMRSAPPAWRGRRPSTRPAPSCAMTIPAARPILALKHADRLDLVPGFALWLERAGRGADRDQRPDRAGAAASRCGCGGGATTRRRNWRGRWPAAPALALDTAALVRSRPTPSQGAMPSARARRRNVLGAFRVPRTRRVAGRNILLVDDVLTTGATAEAASRALKRAGAAKVQVLALARVVRAAEMPI